MQNSAWKLTALAGVIGLGFLIVLQAQKNMGEGEGDEKEVITSGEGKKPRDGQEGIAEQQSEPGFDSEEVLDESTIPVPDYTDRPTLAQNVDRVSPFAPPFTDFAENGGTGITTVSAEETSGLFESAPTEETETPIFGDRDELPLLTDGDTESPPLLTKASEEQPSLLFAEGGKTIQDETKNPFGETETEPITEETEDASKKRAMELIAAARNAMDKGDLDSAGELAQAAQALPVSYTPLDDRPETVLREIDQLLKFQNLPTAAKTEEPPRLLLTSGEENAEEKPFGEGPFKPLTEEKEATSEPPIGETTLFPSDEKPIGPEEPIIEEKPVTETEESFLPFDETEKPLATEAEQPAVPFEPAPFDPVPTEAAPTAATTTVKTESSGAIVTAVTGDATIPKDGPEPALKPELTIEKIAPAEAVLDQPIVYSINVKNRGNATAAQLVVEDRVPKGCRLVGTRPQAVMIGTKLIWRLGKLSAGESEAILVKVVPIAPGEIGSVATVSFVTEVAARTEVRTSDSSPLQLTVEAPPQVAPGETIMMKFRVKNHSTRDAINVKLQDIIPAGLQHETGSDLTYDIGTIEAGTTFSADLELKAVKSGKFKNRATITADGGVRTESISAIEILGTVGISFQAIPAKAVLVGQKTGHATRVTNKSPTDAKPFTIVSRLPNEVRFLSATENGRYDATSHSVRWQVSGLAAGRSLLLESSLQAKSHGTHAALSQLTQDGQPVSKVESQITVQGIAAMAINLEDVPATVLANDEFTIKATVLNRGTGPASDVQLSLVLPEGVEFVTARGPVRLQRQPITLTSVDRSPEVTSKKIPEIGEKASIDFEITLRASKSGRPKIRAQVDSTQLTEAVATEAAIVVIDDAP